MQYPQLAGFAGGNGVIRLIGHRGARGVMPENTLAGFRFIFAIGVQALEFDVVMTRDKVPVVTHNHQLSAAATRAPDGAWLSGREPDVASLSYAELSAFDVGGLDGQTVYGQQFPDQAFLNGETIPRLSDLLALTQRPENANVHLMLELKSDPGDRNNPQARRDLVAATVADVRAHAMQDRTVLHSFDWPLLGECQKLAPDMPTSFLSQRPVAHEDSSEEISAHSGPDFRAMTTSVPQAVIDLGGQMWCPHFSDLTGADVAAAHALGLLVATWTVNTPQDIDRMIGFGVDGIVTDYPGRVQRQLLNHGLIWHDPGA